MREQRDVAVFIGSLRKQAYSRRLANALANALDNVAPPSLVFLDVPTMQQPEAYIGGAATLFDEQGKVTTEGTRQFLTTIMSSFAVWVERFARRA